MQNVNSSNNIAGGVDYDSGPYNVTIPVGQTSVPFDVPITDDNVVEGDEMFSLLINKPLPNGVYRSKRFSMVTIVDTTG